VKWTPDSAEWEEWYGMSPLERLQATETLWQTYLDLGGSLEPEPDTQSPFFNEEEWRRMSAHGRTGLRVIRRC